MMKPERYAADISWMVMYRIWPQGHNMALKIKPLWTQAPKNYVLN